MQCLTKKNTQLSQELEECKAQLEAALATSENVKGTPAGNMCFERYFRFEMRQACNPDDNNADEAGVNPDKQQLLRQLKAGESVLTRVRQEKNKLQDANTQLGEELKDVRIQLSSAVKENRRLRRGIFSKCLNESSKKEFGEEVD